MSTPIQHDALDPNSLQYYAPRRSRHSISDPPSIQPLADADGPPAPQALEELRMRHGKAALADVLPRAVRRLIDDEFNSRPRGSERKRQFAIFAGLAVAAATAVAVTIMFLDTSNFIGRDWTAPKNAAEMPFAERMQAINTALKQVPWNAVTPTLSVEDRSGEVNAPLPLGVEVTNYTTGATIFLSGLLAGSVFSTGTASGEGLWRIAVDELPKARVIPPRDYIGPMTVVAELRGGNGQAIVRSPVHYSWKPHAANSAKAPEPIAAAKTSAADKPEVPRKIEPAEAAALLKRAEALMANGDLPAARLLLQRLAETHDARAAFELGATYDPTVIKQLGSVSNSFDLALASAWYQKAKDWGSSDASAHLDALASAKQ